MNKNSQWYERMLARYGSEEAIREVMRKNSSLSSRNKVGTGGFAKIKQENPERLKEISKQGVASREEKRIKAKDSTQNQATN